MYLAWGVPPTFAGTMPFANEGRAVCLHGEPNPRKVDCQETSAVFAGDDAFGLERFPAPPIEAENPVRLRNCVPTFDI